MNRLFFPFILSYKNDILSNWSYDRILPTKIMLRLSKFFLLQKIISEKQRTEGTSKKLDLKR